MNNGKRHHIVTFGPFEMDLTERLLTRDTKPVAIAPKLFDTLALLVQNAGHVVEKDELMSRLWTGTFVEESSLSQNIFQLRKLLMNGGSPIDYIETISKRGYRFAACVSAPEQKRTTTSTEHVRSIAVMPFAVLGGTNGEHECLGVGMADAISVRLGLLRGLTVMPTRTMLRYAGKFEELQTVARSRGVENVLDGTVQRRGNRIRVTVQLIDVVTEKCVWSGKFDESFEDVFSVQDLISNRVANALAMEFVAVSSERETSDITAFQACLTGVFLSSKRTREGLTKSIEYFREAVERDPRYARAHAGLSDSFFWLAYGQYSTDVRRRSFEQSREHALLAIQLDDSIAEAHAALATVLVKHDHNIAGAEASFRRAIEVGPSCAMAYSRFTYFLAAEGRLDEALEASRRAQELDPLSPDSNAGLAMVLYFLRRYDDAIRYCRIALTLEPTFSEAALLLGRCLEQKGLFDAAEEQYVLASRLEPNCHEAEELRAHLHAISGHAKLAKREVAELCESEESKPHNIAAIYSALGDTERASAWLHAPFINWTERLRMLRYDPRLDSCRQLIEI